MTNHRPPVISTVVTADAAEESCGDSLSPVYDYADLDDPVQTQHLPSSAPTGSIAPPPSSPSMAQLQASQQSSLALLTTPVSQGRIAPSQQTISSVRTMPSSAASTVVLSGQQRLADSLGIGGASSSVQPRNLADAFLPIELTPSPPEATQASQSQANGDLSSVAVALPTPPPARVAWPIGYGSQSSAKQTSSSQKARSVGKRKSGNANAHAASSSHGFFQSSQRSGGVDQTESGSRFAPCPVCAKNVALFDMDRHLDLECGKDDVLASQQSKTKVPKRDEAQSDVKSSTPAAAASSSAAAAALPPFSAKQTPAKRAHIDAAAGLQSGSGFTQCPLCNLSVPLATINHHMDIECGREAKKPANGAANAAAAASTTAHTVAASSSTVSASAVSDSTPVAMPSLELHITPASSIASSAASASAAAAAPTSDLAAASADGVTPSAATPAITATTTATHSFFTAGPRAASAFAPHRKGRNDAVKCQLLSHFTLSTTASATAQPAPPPIDLFQLEWQDTDPSDPSHAPRLVDASTMSAFHTNTKCQEPSIDQWCDVHIHASVDALTCSPAIDLQSPQLLCNTRQTRRFRLSLSMLKSLLQKNVRLSRPAAAVRAALQLMHTNLNEFIRRFTIIIFEDAILHPSFPLLVWLTLACGKANPTHPFTPTHAHINALLQMVHDVASVSTKDALLDSEMHAATPDAKAQPNGNGDLSDDEAAMSRAFDAAIVSSSATLPPTLLDALPTLTPSQRLLIKSLLVRACFGGMPGDITMLRGYAALWCKRFQSENHKIAAATASGDANALANVRRWVPFLTDLYATSPSHLPPKLLHATPIDVRKVTYLHDDDLVLSAIDMHCSQITELLLKKEANQRILRQHAFNEPAAMEKALNSIIWHFRSKLTNKQLLRPHPEPPTDPNHASLFKALKTEIDLTAKRILQQRVDM